MSKKEISEDELTDIIREILGEESTTKMTTSSTSEAPWYDDTTLEAVTDVSGLNVTVWGNQTWNYSSTTTPSSAQVDNSLSVSPEVAYSCMGILVALAVTMMAVCIYQWCITARLRRQARAMRRNSTNIELGEIPILKASPKARYSKKRGVSIELGPEAGPSQQADDVHKEEVLSKACHTVATALVKSLEELKRVDRAVYLSVVNAVFNKENYEQLS